MKSRILKIEKIDGADNLLLMQLAMQSYMIMIKIRFYQKKKDAYLSHIFHQTWTN